jgi:hypothetical protein
MNAMSIDKFHFIAKGENPSDIAYKLKPVEIYRAEAATKLTKEAHTIYEMRAGVEHLYIFEDGAQASEAFERWRSQPCEKIVLTLDGVPQAGDRLPVGTEPGSGCDVDISWDGDFDTDGDPNSPARWKVRCGRPVAGEAKGRPFCQKHLGRDNERF